jgi:Zn-dependent alcohol dehydrogenase
VVDQVGEHVTKVKPGDHVVLTYLPCGTCRNCVQGKPAYCLLTFPFNSATLVWTRAPPCAKTSRWNCLARSGAVSRLVRVPC